MEEENELLDDEEFADGDIIEFLRGLMKECSCTVEKHKTWIASPAAIPKSGERNRKIHSCMLYLISI